MIEVSGDGFEQALQFTEKDIADGFHGHCFNVSVKQLNFLLHLNQKPRSVSAFHTAHVIVAKPQGMVVQQKQEQFEFKPQELDWDISVNLQEGLNSLEFVFQTNEGMHSLVLIVNKYV